MYACTTPRLCVRKMFLYMRTPIHGFTAPVLLQSVCMDVDLGLDRPRPNPRCTAAAHICTPALVHMLRAVRRLCVASCMHMLREDSDSAPLHTCAQMRSCVPSAESCAVSALIYSLL